MPTPPYATLRVALDGGAANTGVITASGGNSCQLSADPAGTSGVGTYKYEIYEYPSGFATPAGWTLDSSTGIISYSASATPPAFTLPTVASGWGKFLLRLTVNNGDPGANPSIPATQLVDEKTVIKVPHWSGIEDAAHLEANQFDSLRAWAGPLKSNIRALAMIASGFHPQVRLATAAALPAYTRVGDVLTANANGALAAVDSVGPAVGDRILLKNGALNSDNGIYVVTSLGSGGTPWVLTRAYDMCTGTTPRALAIGAVEAGSTYANKVWKLTTPNPITLNSTALSFTFEPALKPGTNLTDADATIAVASGNKFTLPESTLTVNRSITLSTTGATNKETIEIVRLDLSNKTLAVINGGVGAGTLYTFPASVARAADFVFDGTNWALSGHAAVV